MRMNLVLIIFSVFIFDASFISLTKAEWKCSFETNKNCFLDLVTPSSSIWKRLNSSIGNKHFDRDKYPGAAKGNFYLYRGLNTHSTADSGRRRRLDSIQLKEMKACLGFYFYIYGRGAKTLKILDLDGRTIWNYSEHTHSWKFTETDIELSHMYNKFYIDVEADYSNVVFALDEMTLRNGNCNPTHSTSVHMSKSENEFQTESSRAISSMTVGTDRIETSSDRTRKKENGTKNSEFQTESFITRSSRAISSMKDVNGGLETSSDRTRKKENGTQPGEIKNESTSAVSTMDNVNGGLPTNLEIESSLTEDINPQRKGNLVGIGLGTAITVLLLLVGVAIYAKRRIGAKESNENCTSNERTDVRMHSLYEDILEQSQPSRREDRETYDVIPENNDAGINTEKQGQPSRKDLDRQSYDVIPENNDTGIYTEVTPFMPVYDTASMETCIYKHLNEVQDDNARTSTYGDFSVYNILSLKPSTGKEITTDQEYDCMNNIEK